MPSNKVWSCYIVLFNSTHRHTHTHTHTHTHQLFHKGINRQFKFKQTTLQLCIRLWGHISQTISTCSVSESCSLSHTSISCLLLCADVEDAEDLRLLSDSADIPSSSAQRLWLAADSICEFFVSRNLTTCLYLSGNNQNASPLARHTESPCESCWLQIAEGFLPRCRMTTCFCS